MASLCTPQNPSFLLKLTKPSKPTSLSPPTIIPFYARPSRSRSRSFLQFSLSASKTNSASVGSSDGGKTQKGSGPVQECEDDVIEVEEELPWIQEKALDLVEFTGSVTQAVPGPRVGSSSLPLILAVPLAYVSVSFVIAVVKTVRKFGSPREKRRRLVNKNAVLCKSVDELFKTGTDAVQPAALIELSKKLLASCGFPNATLKGPCVSKQDIKCLYKLVKRSAAKKTDFGMEEILRKYIRYALNEKQFNPRLVSDLIQLKKASMLEDSQIADILNDISRRIILDKGPVVMDMSGYSEKGFKRKLAMQALFGKVSYLSELLEFSGHDSSLIVKEIFGVTDEDADKLRLHTLSDAGDVDTLEKMVDDDSVSEDAGRSS